MIKKITKIITIKSKSFIFNNYNFSSIISQKFTKIILNKRSKNFIIYIVALDIIILTKIPSYLIQNTKITTL